MIATCVQCVLIYGLSATEAIIIGRYLTKAVVDSCWYIFQDSISCRRTVGISWLVVRAVLATLEVECDVKQVDDCGVRFNGDLEDVLTEDPTYVVC